MPSPQQNLATSLALLKELQDTGRVAIRSKDLTRTHRERLLKNGFLREVMKGWYISARPTHQDGDTTPWFSSFWSFCAAYFNERFQDAWCLSPEHSISLHVGNQTVPRQLQVRSPKASNKPTQLLHGTSVFDARLKLPEETVVDNNLRLFDLPRALIEAVPRYFTENATDARAALATFQDASGILSLLLDGGHSSIAGRLCGAFRNIERSRIADDIANAMKSAGYEIRELDPFEEPSGTIFPARTNSPYAARIRLIWHKMRGDVIEHFTAALSPSTDTDAYLEHVDEVFVTDAYHSLSIEGYRVSRELIRSVRAGDWNPDVNDGDRRQQDALAARGYYQAFQAVKQSVRNVLDGQSCAEVAEHDHRNWYREMFAPLVTVGLLQSGTLAGYRSERVFLRGSRHIPVSGVAVSDLMSTLFELLGEEPSPAVRAVLGHFVFVYIHPYMDGNGRIGRFLMNVLLAAGGFPWTVIPLERRDEYMLALEAASVDQDIRSFATFLSDVVAGPEQRSA